MLGYFNSVLLIILVLSVASLPGCISPEEPAHTTYSANDSGMASDKIRVAATIAPLAEFIRVVGGDKVEVTVVVPPGAEPHTFEPTPSLMVDLSRADLYVMNGAGLEFWMDKLLGANRDLSVLDSSQGIDLLSESEEEINPHIWLSLRAASRQVESICAGLSQVDPDNRDYYAKNRDDYLETLGELDEEFNRSFASARTRIFIVHHPAWSYFARDYALEQVSLMENDKEPGPKYLSHVIDLARENNITTIFVEPQFNPKAAEVIAREMSARVVSLDPLAPNYLESMRSAGRQIADSMAAG